MAQLPEELLSHICSFLRIGAGSKASSDDPDKLSTLLNISLANRALNRAARPHLYHTLHVIPSENLRSVLRTLSQSPETARLVQHLYTEAWMSRSELEVTQSQPNPAESDLRAQLLDAVDGLQVSSTLRQEIHDGVERGLEEAELSLLLCLCVNLKFWETESCYRFEETTVPKVIREAEVNQGADGEVPTMQPLQHLREVDIAHADTEGYMELTELEGIFQLPALETFRGRMLKCDSLTELSEGLRSKVKQIYLESSLIDGFGLQTLLHACPDVQTLSLHWGNSMVGVSRLDFDAMGDALRQHGTHVSTLRLRAGEAFTLDSNAETLPPLGDLKPLTSLRTLTVPYAALLGGSDVASEQPQEWLQEVLPSSLKTLRVTDANNDYWEEFDEQLMEVLRDERFEALSTIRINRPEAFTEDAEEVGWDESGTNKFWVVLKRKPKPDAAEVV